MTKFLFTALIGLTTFFSSLIVARAQEENREAEAAARSALESFITEWNTGDNARLRTAMNFPFVTFGGGSSVLVNETPESFSQDFDRMREREDWTRSAFDFNSIKVFMTSAEKVHLSVVYNRYNTSGESYTSGTVFYIITKKDDHWGIQLRTGGRDDASAEDRAEIIADARAAVLGYMKAFNAADGAETSRYLNYPHLFMMRGGIAVAQAAGDARPDFERMRTTQNWHFSTLDSFEPSIVRENKVHWEVVFSRWHPDGTRYWTVPALWITTKIDNHWGIQLRSLMPATYDAR